VSIAVTDEQRQLAGAVLEWARRARPVAVARAGSWRDVWTDVEALGLLDAALPDGGGASLTDHAVLLEAAARSLVPGPVLPTAMANLLTGSSGHGPVAVVLDPTAVDVTVADGARLTGQVRPVRGADSTTALLLPADGAWFFVGPDADGVKVLDLEPLDLACATADVRLDDTAAERIEGVTGAADLAATLAAAEASGVARWCLDTAVAYAKVREQFGRPIGSFQAIKHLCAQMLCRAEVAAAVAWDAADGYGSEQHPVAAAVAASLALDAAVDNAKDCIQVLGGIGFTWEHEAHLYLRRALTLRQWLGGSAVWRQRVAALTLAGERRTLRVDLGADDTERAAVRAAVAEIARHPVAERRRALADRGYLVPHWPPPYGLDAAPARQLLIDEELAQAGVTRPDLVIAGWALPTILEHGSAEQVERFVRPTLYGEIVWCQLFSEPDAGSDLAALRTRAERVAGGWRLTGQKVWTSLAQRADWGICLARTDVDAPKHRGISYFLVDMRSPGIEVRPLREITGEERFNEVFLDDVFVPDELVVGSVGDGWRLARTTLAHERVAIGNGSSIGEDTERLVARLADSPPDPLVAERLGGLVADGLAGSLLDLRSTLRQLSGAPAGAESSVRKLLGVEHRQQLADLVFDVAGADALTAGDAAFGVLLTRALSIAGGTTQVLRNVVAERLLGLPRE
jgi:alkylation response protein AidB-like acyl-CoA dehydrogenase